MADEPFAELRAAEQRIKELEAKVRLLEDRADRAERWVYKIWVEIEQKFFGGDAIRPLLPPHRQVLGISDDRLFRTGGGPRANDGRTEQTATPSLAWKPHRR